MAEWTEEELAYARKLKGRGAYLSEIAGQLGRSTEAVRKKLRLSSMTPAEHAKFLEHRRLLEADNNLDFVIPEEVVQQREVYINAPHRDITGMFFGDPPRGYSALDQMQA